MRQKELLRQLKLKVDVLSLSATPIPRTLQMSLAGLRDISVIETPPEGRRPIRTYVGPYDEELVRQRDRAREGARRPGVLPPQPDRHAATRPPSGCARSCPGVRFAEAHGQMDESELEQTMLEFLRGDADCLVATTIIESGLDIPQANTLIVERADELGLAQAYQIRGRVGRSRERAYAYLLYPSREALEPGGGGPPGDALRLHRARLRVRDRHARPRAPRRRRPARRRAVGPRRGGRVRALRVAAGRRRARSSGPRAAPERAEARVRLDVDVDAYLPAGLHPVRGGQDRRPPAGRRGARARRAARPARRASRPLRPAAGAGREPARAAARPDRAGRPRGPHGRVPRRAALGRPRSSSTPPPVGRLREGIPEAMYESRVKTLVACGSPTSPTARLAAVLGLAEAAGQALAEPGRRPEGGD